MKRFLGALAVLAALASPAGAAAPGGRVELGVLDCAVSGGAGFIIGSKKDLSCTFKPAGNRPAEPYFGVVKKFGLDVGVTGKAVITGAGRLAAQYVVHTVGPVWHGGGAQEPELLANAYRNSLALAAAHGAHTIAFPAISAGIYGYPLDQAAAAALGVARDFAFARPDFTEIRFVLFSAGSFAAFEAALDALPAATTG